LNENKQIYAFQWIVAVSSSLLILLLLVAWVSTGPMQEWKKMQRAYLGLTEQLADSLAGEAVSYARKGIHQFESSDLTQDRSLRDLPFGH
jgi:hypothetical protein